MSVNEWFRSELYLGRSLQEINNVGRHQSSELFPSNFRLHHIAANQDRMITTRTWAFSNYQLNAQLFYFSTICMLHYAPQHVSSSTLLILRRTNCITTASGIVTLCKQPYSMQVESGLSPPAYCTTVCEEWRYQRLWWYNWSSRGWAACCLKHVEERSVTYILLKNKRIVH
jgi:hypothetical protein